MGTIFCKLSFTCITTEPCIINFRSLHIDKKPSTVALFNLDWMYYGSRPSFYITRHRSIMWTQYNIPVTIRQQVLMCEVQAQFWINLTPIPRTLSLLMFRSLSLLVSYKKKREFWFISKYWGLLLGHYSRSRHSFSLSELQTFTFFVSFLAVFT